MLEYLRVHGESKQDDIRTAMQSSYEVMSRRFIHMEALGLVEHEHRECDDSRHMACFWRLTGSGRSAADVLEAANMIIGMRLDPDDESLEELRAIVSAPHRRVAANPGDGGCRRALYGS